MDPMKVLLAVTIPCVTVLVGLLSSNARITDLNGRISELTQHVDRRFDSFQELMNSRFNEQASQLRRVEQVMDARLKHLEERVR
jgi:hypothetical protein